jgi:hypothetical protein
LCFGQAKTRWLIVTGNGRLQCRIVSSVHELAVQRRQPSVAPAHGLDTDVFACCLATIIFPRPWCRGGRDEHPWVAGLRAHGWSTCGVHLRLCSLAAGYSCRSGGE